MSDSESSALLPRKDSRASRGYESLGAGPGTPSIRETLARGVSVTDVHDNITLSWHKLNVFVQPQGRKCCKKQDPDVQPKQILQDVSGIVKPGTLLAILGASGAGKTTLLNVLNQRNTRGLSIEGEIRVNGEKLGRGITALSAYVQQDDLFIGILKVKEHLWFQSMLRMDKHISTEDRKKRVDSVMVELGLAKCADSMIGTPGRTKGISGGEMKRLAFASEVLTNPALLFCDEPTSGLDSFMAENVVQTLKSLADKGKTVICTIHQPSSEVYALFEQVLYMAEGRVAYMGPSKEMFGFFEGIGYSCPPNFNPADYFIHTLAIVPGKELECKQRVKKVCDAYTESDQCEEMRFDLEKASDESDPYATHIEDLMNRSPYKASWLRQFIVVFWRSWVTNIREPMLLRIRIFQTMVIAIVLGLIFLNQSYDQAGVMNINGALFLLQMQMSFGQLFSVINTFPLELPVFMREHHNGMYRTDVYYLSKMGSELLWFILIPVVFTAITYWMIGLNADAESFLICMGTMILVANVSIAFGYMVSTAASDVNIAVTIAPLVMIPMLLFGGFFLNADTVPVYFLWMKYLSWFNYANEILVVNQWEGVTNISCPLPPGPSPPGPAPGNFSLPSLSGNFSGSLPENFSGSLPSLPGNFTPPDPSAGMRCFRDGQAVIDSLNFQNDRVFQDFMIILALLVGFRLISFLMLLIRTLGVVCVPGEVAAVEDTSLTIPSSPSICERLALGLNPSEIKEEITLSWQGVSVHEKIYTGVLAGKSYTEIRPRQILNKVNGIAKPGTLLAIMGASGAGKTTLLNVLNQRNTQGLSIEGEIRVNGEKLGRGITALSAYVQQDDLFIGILTVREHLKFQALLRMDADIADCVKTSRVEQVIQELGLAKCADSKIGTPGKAKGISGGEMKRLAFASEVLTNPALLFCDEPTSGLDSFMAENVVQTLKSLAEKGKTVICTIHQPSSEVYALFEQVLFMAEGRVAYMGPANSVHKFFSSVSTVCPPNYNPADFYIHSLAIKPGKEVACKDHIQDVCEAYCGSDQYQEIKADLNNVIKDDSPNTVLISDIMNGARYKVSWITQFIVVLWRSWLTILREPMLLRVKIGQTIIIGLILGLIFLNQENNQEGVMNINGALFIMQMQMSINNMFSVINTYPLEMPVFIREHQNGMYRVDVYYLAKMIAEFIWFVILPVLFTSITYWMIGLNDNLIAFFVCAGTLVLVAHVATAFAYMVSIGTGDANLAVTVTPLILMPMLLFGGFFLNSDTVPIYFLWMKYLSWFNYANEVLIVNQWQNITNIGCEFTGPGASQRCFTTGQDVIDSLNFDNDLVFIDCLVMIGLLVGFRILAFVFLLIRARKK